MERTFTFAKPDIIKIGRHYEAFSYLDNRLLREFGKFERTGRLFLKPSEKLAQQHYIHIKNLGEKFISIYNQMIRQMTETGVLATIYRGREGLAQAVKELVGSTNPKKATKGTIRNLFSNDDLEEAKKQGRPTKNAMHSSDSEKAEEEIRLWACELPEGLMYFLIN